MKLGLLQSLSEAKEEYKDSTEFTEELHTIDDIIRSKRFYKWLEVTDENFGTNTVKAGGELKKAMDNFWKEMEKAE